MEIDRDTRVMTLVADPDLRAVLEWYGLPTDDRSQLRLTLESFCLANDVDVEDVLVELAVSDADSERDIDDDEDEDGDPLWV